MFGWLSNTTDGSVAGADSIQDTGYQHKPCWRYNCSERSMRPQQAIDIYPRF